MGNVWPTILIAGLLTWLTRLSFIALQGHWSPPALMRRALAYIPPAVLSAIIFPEVLRPGLLSQPLAEFPRLGGALVALLLAWRTRNLLLTILAGMAALYLLQALLP